jgi:hypothetical protein
VKTTIVDKHPTAPKLWKFMQDKLPEGLALYEYNDGYGSEWGVCERKSGMARILSKLGASNRVATFEEARKVKLHDPYWTSDFENILIAFELAEGGPETELLVCQ